MFHFLCFKYERYMFHQTCIIPLNTFKTFFDKTFFKKIKSCLSNMRYPADSSISVQVSNMFGEGVCHGVI